MEHQQQYQRPYQAQPQHTRYPSDSSDETVFGGFTNYDPAAVYLTSEYSAPKPNNVTGQTVRAVGEPATEFHAQHAAWNSDHKSTDSKAETRHSRLSSLGKLRNIKVPKKTGSWTWEIVALLLAVGAVASIIALLARYDGRPLPSWPYEITLNALIAVLTTIANASMAVPLSSGLGQLKWERMKKGYAPLADMEVLDEASRGAWGAVNMLRRLRGGVFGSLGAVAVIVALFLSPFAQQVVIYRTLPQESETGATNYRAMNFTVALPSLDSAVPFVPVLPIKSAVYNGLFAENNKPWTSLPVSCETGNCTWEPFDTLANVTHRVENNTIMSSSSAITDLAPIVVTSDAAHNTSSPAALYVLSAEAMLGIQSWFAQLFANGSATRTDSVINTTLTSAANAPIAVNLTVGISSGATFFDTDIVQAFYWNYYEYPSGLDMLMNDLSVSLTVAFRSLWGAEAVNGTAFTNESFVYVRWGFITPLILSVALTAGFLAQAIYRSWRCGAKLWKSSVLAVLFHGLEDDVRERFVDVGEFGLQRLIARDVKVRLDEDVAAGGLLRAERVY
ncbi:hypothetical protein SLS63_003421 [Diaporthe eres]|uniref:Uncharacterized protein n=1 Tax=Diaporthe eres TaxID=83184 RepID=A0ABR1PHP0_DIAER